MPSDVIQLAGICPLMEQNKLSGYLICDAKGKKMLHLNRWGEFKKVKTDNIKLSFEVLTFIGVFATVTNLDFGKCLNEFNLLFNLLNGVICFCTSYIIFQGRCLFI